MGRKGYVPWRARYELGPCFCTWSGLDSLDTLEPWFRLQAFERSASFGEHWLGLARSVF